MSLRRFLVGSLVGALVSSCTANAPGPTAHDHAGGAPPAGSAAGGHDGHGAEHAGAVPSGYAPIPAAGEQFARLGLTTTAVAERAFTRNLRNVGVVAVDEARSSHVHPKVRGWIEQVQVNFTGKEIRRGASLCTIYSPEILSAELELLAILEQGARAPQGAPSAFSEIEQRARAVTLESARRRLRLWDVPQSEIDRLERTRQPSRTFPLLAPRAGTVVAKQALAGMYVDASTELYLVSDLSRVWVLVDLYDADLPYVQVGDRFNLAIEGAGPELIEASLSFLAPTVDEATRTVKARFELDNRDRRLRPGSFATAEASVDAGRGLAVPESAVIRTGERNIVFVVGPERAEPREIEIAGPIGGWYRILGGLHVGESVATSAQFLLDSESRIRATSAPGGAHGGH
jgi:membrane fusion protein, copper/silver efflux system